MLNHVAEEQSFKRFTTGRYKGCMLRVVYRTAFKQYYCEWYWYDSAAPEAPPLDIKSAIDLWATNEYSSMTPCEFVWRMYEGIP